MSRKKTQRSIKAIDTEKKPLTAETINGSSGDIDNTTIINSSTTIKTKSKDVSTPISEDQLKIRGRHFAYVVYPESAPEDWVEQLKRTGLAFVVSPLHDMDINPDGSRKKEHYHVIVSWANSTTYRSAVGLCKVLNCPRPQALKGPKGMYRYLTHKDNPEKYQYTGRPECFNGWARPLDNGDVLNIKSELTMEVCLRDCHEYAELLFEAEEMGAEYLEIAQNNTLYFAKLCDGFRNNPVRVLYRARAKAKDKAQQAVLDKLLDAYMNGPRPEDGADET